LANGVVKHPATINAGLAPAMMKAHIANLGSPRRRWAMEFWQAVI